MKKYFQITAVLGILGFFVFIKQTKGSSGLSMPAIGGQNSINTNQSLKTQISYKNGTYTGSIQDAYYGSVQVQATITDGKIADVKFLQYPSDNRTSRNINSQAMPLLTQEVIAMQSANVSGVSGASATSPAFIASLTDAINQAK